jgi:hypothetical protein
MADIIVERSSLENIANAIREKNGTEDIYKPSEMPQAIRDIPISGGTDSYYDTFWDAYQQNGERTYYSRAFFGAWWNNDNFKPKYDLIIKDDCTAGFQNSSMTGDLSQTLKDCNVVLDTSECTNLIATFQGTRFTKIPTISFAKCDSVANTTFYGCNLLETIEKLIVHSNLTFTNTFNSCIALKNIVIEGEIGKSISFAQSSLLTNESAKSIITHLVNHSGTENEGLNKVTFHSDVWDRLDAEGNTAPDGMTWKDYVTTIGWEY